MSAPATPIPATPLGVPNASPNAAPDTAAPRSSRPENPYVGPRSFLPGEKLFGRARETDALVDLLLAERIVLLHSQSGAGKSSLLNAGVIPRLREERLEVLPPVRVNALPASPPPVAGWNRYVLSVLTELEKARTEGRPGEARGTAELATLSLAEYLATRPRTESVKPEVLILDQFEELLTADPGDAPAKDEFCRQLGEALKIRTRWAIVAMREESMGALAPYLRHIPTALAHRFRLDLLSPAMARESISRPAEGTGRSFLPETVDQLVRDLGGGRDEGTFVEPVHLQVVCTQVWENVPPDAVEIRPSDVTEVGGVDEALMTYYADAVAHAARVGQASEADVRAWVEETLVSDDRRAQALLGTQEARGVPLGAVKGLENRYVVRLEDRRAGVWVELAHDRLIAPVRKDNARWREGHLSPLERRADRWARSGRPDDLLVNPFDREFLSVLRAARVPERVRLADPTRTGSQVHAYAAASVQRAKGSVLAVAALLFALLVSVAFAVAAVRANARLTSTNTRLVATARELRTANVKLDSLRGVIERRAMLFEKTVDKIDSARAARPAYGSSSPLPAADPGRVAAGAAAVTVHYFPKSTDSPALVESLRRLPYRLSIRAALYDDLPTNFVAFGARVPAADVRRIALAALDAGAPLQAICRFASDRGAAGADRSMTVQVIGSDAATRRPRLTREQVEQADGQPLQCR